MGKKSSSKKIKKEEIIVNAPKIKHFKRIPMLAIILINIIAVIFAGFVIWKYFTMVTPIGNFLPLDRTIAYTEFYVDENDQQVKDFFNMTKANPFLKKEHLKAVLEDLTGENFNNGISPWLGRNIGMALIGSTKMEDRANVLIFAETKDRDEALNFFKKLGLQYKNDSVIEKDYNSYTIYSYKTGEEFSFTFIGKYAVISTSEESMEDFIDGVIDADRLASGYGSDFSRTYINPKLLAKFLGSQGGETKNRYLITIFDPLISIFKNVWIRTEVKYGHINLESTTEFKYKFEKGPDYSAELLAYLPEKLKVFYGGSSLMSQIDNLSAMVEKENPDLKKTIKELVNFQIKDTFGDSILLERDVYPIIGGEYAFAVTDDNSVIFELKTDAINEDGLKKIMVNLRKSPFMTRAIYTQDSVAIRQNVLFSENAYRGMNIFGVQLENAKWGIYSALINGVIFSASNEDSLKKTIDIFIDGKNNFKNSEEFKNGPDKVLSGSDEIFYVNLYNFPDFMTGISPYLEAVKVISMGRKYSDNYVKSNCIILVE